MHKLHSILYSLNNFRLIYLFPLKENESIDDISSKCSTPKLIGAGDLGEITPLYIVAEGAVILKLNNMSSAQALVL